MIKKAGNIVIILFLLIATAGIPVTRHYCGSTAKSFSVFSTPKSCCDSHCNKCHNVFKFSKISDVFEVGTSLTLQTSDQIFLLQTAQFVELFDHLLISKPLSLINQRDINLDKAGDSPAFFGNFRC